MSSHLHTFISNINKSINSIKVLSSIKRVTLKKLMDFRRLIYSNKVVFHSNPIGINILGLVSAEMGLGQSTRMVIDSLLDTRYKIAIKDFELVSNISRNNQKYSHLFAKDFKYNINLVHLNPPELNLAHFFLPGKLWKNRYNIGFWLWELETLPKDWIKSIKYVDEIWTPSEFITRTIKKYTKKPVYTMRYPIRPIINHDLRRHHFNLPEDRFLFITLFDFNSTLERKNPKATIEAYRRLESIRNNVGLVIKINHVNTSVLAQLKELTEDLKCVYVVAETLSDIETHTLIYLCDALISLHRAEGFGLTMAEAMYLGVPAIATNWSANTEFMKDTNACLVDYDLIEIKSDHTFYKRGNVWAEPKIEKAFEFMVQLVDDRDYYNLVALSGENYIKEIYNIAKSSKIMKDRIQEIERKYQ